MIGTRIPNPKISSSEIKDLEKFMRFFTLKAAQVIVTSRMGEKIYTKCDADSNGTVWFNLNIKDLPDVLAEAKKAMHTGSSSRKPVCVEISLKTPENDTMVLENWSIEVTPDVNPSIPINYTVYNRMGILLKSLVSVSRVTPAYRISRRQGPESYVICYNIYIGEPHNHTLGEGHKHIRVGQLSTQIGTLSVSVAYRTKLTISPQQSGKDNAIMLKSDHFKQEKKDDTKEDKEESAKNTTRNSSNQPPAKPRVFKPAFSDPNLVVDIEPEYKVPSLPKFWRNMLREQEQRKQDRLEKERLEKERQSSTDTSTTSAEDKSLDNKPSQKDKGLVDPNGNSTPRSGSVGSQNEFVVVEKRREPILAFARENNPATDGMLFLFRDVDPNSLLDSIPNCRAPVLDQVGPDLSEQLEVFETTLKEFDTIVGSMEEQDNNN